MAKVYVSSTYEDLKECRARVNLVLRKVGHEDASMEYYGAGDRRPVEKCLADVAACDLYVGLFAWRYGYVPEGDNADGLSVTEMEYRQAQKHGKACLIFLLSEDAPWPRSLMDRESGRIERLRAELSAKHVVGLFTSAEDIVEAVYPAVYKWSEEHGHLPRGVSIPQLDLSAYISVLTRRYQHLDLDVLTPPQRDAYLRHRLREVFVEPYARENPPPVELPKEVWEKLQRDSEFNLEDMPAGVSPEDVLRARASYFEKPPRPVLEVLTDPEYRHAVILGDPGSGKSTFARYVLLSLLGIEGDERLRRALAGHLPLLIELRSYVELGVWKRSSAEIGDISFLDFIEHMSESEGWGLDRDALEHYLKEDGRAVVLFDGLDEIFNPEEREAAARRIAGFASSYPNARVVVTSRVIGYRRNVLTDAEFSHFTLQDLDERQVEQFIDRWYALALDERPEEARARRERIMRSFKDSPSIRQLAGNPMLLTIMAIIGKNQELPRERWKLYDHAASVLIHHWDVERHLRDRHLDAPFIGEEEKKELLRRLAFRMQSGEGGLAGNYIHRDDLQREFESYLRDRFAQSPADSMTIARAMIDQFRERNFILSLHGANLYGFVHRAFLEFFCASAFVEKFNITHELSLEELTQVYESHWADRLWHEVLLLICLMVDVRHAAHLIDYMASSRTSNFPPEDSRPWNVSLAIKCFGGLRRRGVEVMFVPARKLLSAVCRLFIASDLEPSSPRGRAQSPPNAFLEDEIVRPAELIGVDWPGRDELARILSQREVRLTSGRRRLDLFARFISAVGAGNTDIGQSLLRYVDYPEYEGRLLAQRALVLGWWGELGTMDLLYHQAQFDADERVRADAIRALVKYSRDNQETQVLLHRIAQPGGDSSERVRALTVQGLKRGWPDEPGTLRLMDALVAGDESERVRTEAAAAALSIRSRRARLWADWLNGVSAEDDYYKLPEASPGFPVLTVHSLRLRNIRVFADTGELLLRPTDKHGVPRPILILGDNAAGKSTLLRCIALATLGSELANQAERRPEGYLRHGSARGFIEVLFRLQLDLVADPTALGTFCIGLEIRAGENSFRPADDTDLTLGGCNAAPRLNWLRRRTDSNFGFVCAYGAQRGLSDDPNALKPEEPKEALERVITLFRTNVPLMDPDVISRMLAGDLSNFRGAPATGLGSEARGQMLEQLKLLLPGIEGVDSSGASTVTVDGVPVPLRELSEGYGSLLSLLGHLFRHALALTNWEGNPSDVWGLVLIDEVDLHLHPAWQQSLIYNLCRVFPHLQFIATTHSPLIVGGLSPEQVLRFARDEAGEAVRRSIKPDMTVGYTDQILTSSLFGLETTLDTHTQMKVVRYRQLLSMKQRDGDDQKEIEELERVLLFRVPPPSGTYAEKHREMTSQAQMLKRVAEKFKAEFPKSSQSVIDRAERLLSDIEGEES